MRKVYEIADSGQHLLEIAKKNDVSLEGAC